MQSALVHTWNSYAVLTVVRIVLVILLDHYVTEWSTLADEAERREVTACQSIE